MDDDESLLSSAPKMSTTFFSFPFIVGKIKFGSVSPYSSASKEPSLLLLLLLLSNAHNKRELAIDFGVEHCVVRSATDCSQRSIINPLAYLLSPLSLVGVAYVTNDHVISICSISE